MRLGDLEQQVMAVLWDLPADASVREVSDRFPDHAYTTLLTVLDRLEKKGMVVRARAGRAYRYRPAASRGAYAAAVMRDALRSTPDPDAALVHFAGSVSEEEAALLRRILAGDEPTRPEAPPAVEGPTGPPGRRRARRRPEP